MIITQNKDVKIWYTKYETATSYNVTTMKTELTDEPPVPTIMDCHSFNIVKEMLPKDFCVDVMPNWDPLKPNEYIYNIDIHPYKLEFTQKAISKIYFKELCLIAGKDTEYLEDKYEELKI